MTTPFHAIPALGLHGVANQPQGDAPAFDVTFEARRRHITALLGRAGSGKTATVRAIAGLDAATGSVVVEGADVSARAPHLRAVGLVPQGLGLTLELSIADSIRFGLRAARHSAMEREVRLAELLRVAELPERGDVRLERLSYREQVNVAIARSLATEPVLLLLDDPLGPLRGGEREAARQSLRALLRRLTLSALVTTPDPDDAAALADDVAVIEEGRIVQVDTTANVLARPGTVSAALLVGYEILIQGRVEGDRVSELGVGSVPVPEHLPRDASVHFMAHPAGILAVPRGHGLGLGVAGAVTHARPLGPIWLVEVALGSRTTILARWEWDPEPPVAGSQVELAATGGAWMYVGEALYEEPATEPPASPEYEAPPLQVSSTG